MAQASNIFTREPVFAEDEKTSDNPSHDGGNGGGDDMLQRVKELEKDVQQMKTDIAVIKETMCTKAYLHQELNGQTWKIIGAMIVTVLMSLLAKHFLS